jgi:hypothetical protein
MLRYSICSGCILSGCPVDVQLAVVLASGVRGGQRRTFGVDASALHLLRDNRLHRPFHLRSGHQRSRLVVVVVVTTVVVVDRQSLLREVSMLSLLRLETLFRHLNMLFVLRQLRLKQLNMLRLLMFVLLNLLRC